MSNASNQTAHRRQSSPYFSVEIAGDKALFTEPFSKASGDRVSYPIPTYAATVGMLKSIYWKPTFSIVVDKIRVMNEIGNFASVSSGEGFDVYMREGGCPDSPSQSMRSTMYLRDVRYKVLFHYEWNPIQTDLALDRNFGKHNAEMRRCVEHGGRRNPCLGATECFAFVSPSEFSAGAGAYDDSGVVEFGWQHHSHRWPNEYPVDEGKLSLYRCWWEARMTNGVLEFPHPLDSVPASADSRENSGRLVHEFVRTISPSEHVIFRDVKNHDAKAKCRNERRKAS